MANSTFIQQVKSIDPRVKTFNVSGTLWDVGLDLIEYYRRYHQRLYLNDVQVALELWNSGKEDSKFTLPQWLVVFWSIMFGAIVLASIFGNLIVIMTVFSDKKMRSVTNYFLVNLSISDLTQSTLVTIFSFVFLLTQEWQYGPVMCWITQYVSIVSVSCSSFTLTAISLERYYAIVHPLRRRPANKRATIITITFLWGSSLLLALPQAIYTKFRRLDQVERFVCVLDWPERSLFWSPQEFAYNLALTIIIYVLPLGTMIFTYTRAGIKLWSSSIGEPTEQQLKKVQSKRKVVKMLIVSVAVFGFCWLPYHAYFLISWLYPEINYWPHIQQVYIGIFWLAMSSSMYSPIVYCIMNSTFRSGSKKVFACFWHCSCLTWRNAMLNPAHTRSCRPALVAPRILITHSVDVAEAVRHQIFYIEAAQIIPPSVGAEQLNRTISNKKSFSAENLPLSTRSSLSGITLLRRSLSLTHIQSIRFLDGECEKEQKAIEELAPRL